MTEVECRYNAVQRVSSGEHNLLRPMLWTVHVNFMQEPDAPPTIRLLETFDDHTGGGASTLSHVQKLKLLHDRRRHVAREREQCG